MPAAKEYDGPALRTGTWGERRKECAAIEAFQKPPGLLHGPFTVDYLPGGIFKIMESSTPCFQRVCEGHDFLRYADDAQLVEMYEALRHEDEDIFLALITNITGRMMDGKRRVTGELDKGWGGQDEVCKWIEGHDHVFVNYVGKDVVWPDGCWEVVSNDNTRQLLDVKGLDYVAHNILGMPKGRNGFKQTAFLAKGFIKAQNAVSVEDAFGIEDEAPDEFDLFADDGPGDTEYFVTVDEDDEDDFLGLVNEAPDEVEAAFDF